MPKALTYSGSWEGIRKFILDETEIIKIYDVHEAFEGVLLEQIAIVLRKKQNDKGKFVEVQYVDLPYTKNVIGKHKVDTKLFNNDMFPIYSFESNEKLKQKISENTRLLENISISPRGLGIQKFKYLFSDKPPSKDYKRVLIGDDVKKYGFKKESYLPYTREEFKTYEDRIKELDAEKIVVQNIVAQTGNRLVIIANYDNQKSITLDTVNNIIINDKEFNPKYVLGVLNSKLAEYYSFNFIFNRAVRTMHFETVRKLPIKILSEPKQQIVIDLVDKVLKEDPDSDKAKEIREKIDKEIYSIYQLNPKQIEMIEDSYE